MTDWLKTVIWQNNKYKINTCILIRLFGSYWFKHTKNKVIKIVNFFANSKSCCLFETEINKFSKHISIFLWVAIIKLLMFKILSSQYIFLFEWTYTKTPHISFWNYYFISKLSQKNILYSISYSRKIKRVRSKIESLI